METANRKLTTVFSADVQGFSRLMEADEEGTFATLKTYRDAMARLIASHGGRVVNTWGDGVIAEFASVVAAVRAAVDVQNELATHNAERPDGARMFFRIGINLGDVIVDGSDIYGDGVNIAARLQAEAKPGGILISNTVYDQVRNKMPVGFEFLGNLSVKNIDEAIPSYAVRIGEPAAAQAANWGRQAAEDAARPMAAMAEPVRGSGLSVLGFHLDRKQATLVLIGAALVAINLIASPQVFWARWPLLVFALIAGLDWARRTTRFGRTHAVLLVMGLFITGINLASWEGEFWAIWPLLAFAIAAAARWLMRRSA
ncbi:adenylate/guanylate cyclase domain-containing protein [Mesorhizobium sp. LHD-90]|uniref:adenylate/guanylate cyclase domain-containing protein n=1 Tax=Mesorhizobium sp. LHD-90 TaxID=3071414 RepID=UPI0027DF6D96|nr:adenylate/guanylate cyclase domain-containing protein [Mesorhizobium sp. LHD-90]MDQ6436010.1 adenylate/guanylate cyclase domain-containing protein [Mesorhizobium sp. LHD-90]